MKEQTRMAICCRRAPHLRWALGIAFALLVGISSLRAQVRTGASPEELNKGRGTVQKKLEHRMTPVQLDQFLKMRTAGGMFGSFADFSSFLWAVPGIGIWCEGLDIGENQLSSPFPDDYKPTWKEFMDALARQVDCSWHYNPDTGYWVFETNAMACPFSLKTADGWTRRGCRGLCEF